MYKHHFHSHSQTKQLITMCIFLSCRPAQMFLCSRCVCLQRSKQRHLLNRCLPWIALFVVVFFSLRIYFFTEDLVSYFISTRLLFFFFFPCSYKENVFLIILLFVYRFTYYLSKSSSRTYRNKLLGIWTTMDAFIDLNLSKSNIQILF